MEKERITIIAAEPKVSLTTIVIITLVLAVLYFVAAITIVVAMYVIGLCIFFLAVNYLYVKIREKLPRSKR